VQVGLAQHDRPPSAAANVVGAVQPITPSDRSRAPRTRRAQRTPQWACGEVDLRAD
jgi:hypothetical protein